MALASAASEVRTVEYGEAKVRCTSALQYKRKAVQFGDEKVLVGTSKYLTYTDK